MSEQLDEALFAPTFDALQYVHPNAKRTAATLVAQYGDNLSALEAGIALALNKEMRNTEYAKYRIVHLHSGMQSIEFYGDDTAKGIARVCLVGIEEWADTP